MPTTARRGAFIPRAIDLFFAQDYPNKRLLIVEDGEGSVADLVPASPLVTFLRWGAARRPIGEKRNLACAWAEDGLIAHWDDDDWHAPRRLSTQVALMQEKHARLSGLDQLVLYDGARAWCHAGKRPESGRPWLAGGTFVYERSVWREQPFQPVSDGEDTAFLDVFYRRDRPAVISDPSLYVARLHADNTSGKHAYTWGGFDVGEVRRWLGEERSAA